MYDCGIPSSPASSTQQSEDKEGACRMDGSWGRRVLMFVIAIMSVKGSDWPPAPLLFNNPIITRSILTGDPLLLQSSWMRVTSMIHRLFVSSAEQWQMTLYSPNSNTSLSTSLWITCRQFSAELLFIYFCWSAEITDSEVCVQGFKKSEGLFPSWFTSITSPAFKAGIYFTTVCGADNIESTNSPHRFLNPLHASTCY